MAKVLLAILLTCVGATAWAQDQSTEEKLRDALRKSTVELRSLQDSQAALQAQLDQAQKQRDLLQQQVQDLTAKLSAQPQAAPAAGPTPQAPAPADAELTQLRQALADAKQQNAALQQGLAKWQSAYQQAAGVAQAKDAEARRLGGGLALVQGKLGICQAKNTHLLSAAEDILHLYETQGFRSILLGSYEPLLGLKRVELENIVQTYDDRVRDQAFLGTEQPAAPPAAATGASKPAAKASTP